MTIPTRRLDSLDLTIVPQRDYEIAAMRDGISNKLRVEQILGLLLSGDIPDEAVTTAKLADKAATDDKLADMAQATVKGRAASDGTGAPTNLTAAQLQAILDMNAPRLRQRVVATPYTDFTSTTSEIPADDTIPQSTEGLQILSAAITPISASSRLRAYVEVAGKVDTANIWTIALFRGGANAIAARPGNSGQSFGVASLMHEEAAGTTSEITLTVRVGPAGGGTLRINGVTGGRIYGGALQANLIVEEWL